MSSQITEISELRAELVAVRAEVEALQILFNDRKGQKKESYYQKFLERKLNAKRLYLPDVGITDLTTSDAHIEIKNWDRYQQVPGQLATYQQAAHRARSVVYFFGAMPRFTRVQQIRRLMKRHQIEMLSIDVDDHITSYDILSKQKEICPLDGWELHIPAAVAKSLEEQKEVNCPFDSWFNEHLIEKPGNQIHIHRFERMYKRALRMGLEGIPLKAMTVENKLKIRGYQILAKKNRDSGCACATSNKLVVGLDIKDWTPDMYYG